MTGHQRSSIRDRGPAADLFDDPPFHTRRDSGRRRSSVLRRVVIGVAITVGTIAVLVVVVAVLLAYSLSHLNLGAGFVPLTPPSSYGLDIALSPDGSRAYVTEPSDNRLVVLDAHTGEQLATVAVGDDPSGLALSPDGTQLWVVNTALSLEASGSVTVITTATDSVVGTVPVGPDPIDLAFSPNGRWAYVTNNGVISPGTVNVIDTSTLAVIGTIAPLAPPSPASWGWNPTSVAVTPDGRQLWVSEVDNFEDSSTSTDFVYVFDATFGAQEARIPVGAGPYFMVLSRDGREAYVADKLSCDVREIDTATFRVVATVRWPSGHGCPFGLAAGPSDNIVYTVTGSDDTIDEPRAGRSFGSVDFATAQALVSGPVGTDPVTLALSPDGATAYVVDASNPVVDLVDPSTGAVTSTFRLPVPASLPASSTTDPSP